MRGRGQPRLDSQPRTVNGATCRGKPHPDGDPDEPRTHSDSDYNEREPGRRAGNLRRRPARRRRPCPGCARSPGTRSGPAAGSGCARTRSRRTGTCTGTCARTGLHHPRSLLPELDGRPGRNSSQRQNLYLRRQGPGRQRPLPLERALACWIRHSWGDSRRRGALRPPSRPGRRWRRLPGADWHSRGAGLALAALPRTGRPSPHWPPFPAPAALPRTGRPSPHRGGGPATPMRGRRPKAGLRRPDNTKTPPRSAFPQIREGLLCAPRDSNPEPID